MLMHSLRHFVFLPLVLGMLGISGATPITPADMRPETPDLRPNQIELLIQTLSDWQNNGLGEIFGSGIDLLKVQHGGPSGQALTDLRNAVIRYAKIQHGQPDDIAFRSNWAIHAPIYDAEGAFDQAIAQDRLAEWIASLPPPFKAYSDLMAALNRYRQIAANGGWAELTGALPLKEGTAGPEVEALRARLVCEGYGVMPDDHADQFDQALTGIVEAFQASHGLPPTGIVNAATRAALNVPVNQRIEQIAANLERWRWLRRDLPLDRIEVNIAAATAALVVHGQQALAMRTIVGRPSDQTPMLEASIDSIVLNPSWLVPTKITAREILPKVKHDPDYLSREGFVFETIPGTPGRMRLRQLPGQKNALGHIKFDLPNRFSVYLHDTPARELFAKDRRALSHGCIRLEKPLDLALALLKADPAWSPEAVQKAIEGGATKRILLATPMPVFLLYWTASVNADGSVNFWDDLYGWDQELLHRLRIG
jgi:murein L,D-transpeptidase YcbB/YkuD